MSVNEDRIELPGGYYLGPRLEGVFDRGDRLLYAPDGVALAALHNSDACAFAAEMNGGWRVPEGYKLVPIKPTLEMLSAADALGTDSTDGGGFFYQPAPDRAWPAMLAVAPKPPSAASPSAGMGSDRRER